MKLTWKWVGFKEMSNSELYDLLTLRAKFYIVKKNYAYNDLDGRDKTAQHLLCFLEQEGKEPELVACGRMMSPKHNENILELGRIVVKDEYQRKGIGKELLKQLIAKADAEHGEYPIHLTIADDKHSKHLPAFYQKQGFVMKGVSNNHHYQYENFSLTCFEMERPAVKPILKYSPKNNLFKSLEDTSPVVAVQAGEQKQHNYQAI